jgi:cytoskeletal protein RodZ
MNQHEENIESFGEYLKREREFRDIPLEEIAAYTRIKLRALQAIEQDDFAALPPLAFVRAFIRCHADYIGLNVNDVMLRFDAFIQDRYPELTGEAPIIPKMSKPEQRYMPLVLVILFILLIVLAFWLTREPKGPGAGNVDHSIADSATAGPDTGKPSTSDFLAGDTKQDDINDTNNGDVWPGDSNEKNNTKKLSLTIIPSSPWTSKYKEKRGPPLSLAMRYPENSDGTAPVNENANLLTHRVILNMDDKCYVKFFIDSDEARHTMLKAGQKAIFEAESFLRIQLSNPDGVGSVNYNGESYDYRPTCYPWWLSFPESPDNSNCHQ